MQIMSSRNIMIVDAYAILYKSLHAKGGTTSGIKDLINLYATNHKDGIRTILVLDSKLDRRIEGREYKSNRTFNPIINTQSDFIENYFPRMGIDVFRKPFTEADDIIYTLVQQYKDNFSMIYIKTDDSDNYGNLCQGNIFIEGIREDSLSFDIRTFESCEIRGRHIPFNFVLPYNTLFGKPANTLPPLKLSKNKNDIFDDFITYFDKNGYSRGQGSNKTILLQYLSENLKSPDPFLTSADVSAIFERTDKSYPKLVKDIVLPDVPPAIDDSFFIQICKNLPALIAVNMFNLQSKIATTPYNKEASHALKAMSINCSNLMNIGAIEGNMNKAPVDSEYTAEFIDSSNF